MRWGFALTAWLFAVLPGVARAATVVWNGTGTGVWADGPNWVGGSAPGATDTASFSNPAPGCTINAPVSVAAISITNTVTITVSSGNTVTTTGDFTQSAGTFNGGDSRITIGGNLVLSTGTFKSTTGLLRIAGAFTKTGGTFNANSGRVMLASTSTQTFATNGATFKNLYVNDGLVGYWKLDDSGTTVADASGYGNDGTRSAAGATWQTDVPSAMDFTDSGSLALNGSTGYVTLGLNNLPNINGAQTISLWTKPTNTTQNGNMIALTNNSNAGIQLKVNSGNLGAYQWGGGTLISTTAPSAGAWHHVAYVYDGAGHQTLYIDGTATTATVTNQSGTVTVADLGTYSPNNEMFNGSLDEVRIYSRALSAADIATLASGAQPGTGVAVQNMTGTPVISGDLTIASGTLAAGTNSFTVGGSWWNYGMFAGTGTVTFNGSGTSNSILLAGDPPAGLTISGTGSWSIVDGSSIPVTLTGSYTQSAGTFTAGAGLLNIAGAFNKSAGTFNGGGGQVMLSSTSSRAFTTTGTTSFSNLTINDGLAGYWTLDEGTGSAPADSSGYGNGGSFTGAAWLTSGLPSTNFTDSAAGSFNGSSSFVDISTPVTPTNAAYSACAWVYMTSNSGYRTFVSIDGTTDSAFFLQKRADTGKFGLTMLASDMDSAAATHADSTTTPATNTWYHICGTYDLTNLKIYVNGSLEGTTAMSSPWRGTGHTIIGAGKFSGNHVDWVAGYIDDVRIYSRALAASEVSALGAGYQPGTGTAVQTLTGSPSISGDLVIASGTLSAGS
ncbi:MAG: LamG domain-containing protein, partial [Verrucomicrobiota bacterium]